MTDESMEIGEPSDAEPPLSSFQESLKTEFRFENGMMLHLMFAGNLPLNLKEQGKRLGVRFVSRDNWVSVEADDQTPFDRGVRFLKELRSVWAEEGSEKLRQCDFDFVLSACSGQNPNLLQNCYSARICVSPRKKAVVPRTENQLNYVSSMRKSDVVFGLGPAGSGKTYLAMASAVSELLQGIRTRIVLTRPAVEAGESLGFLPGTLQDKISPYLRPLYDALYEMLDVQEAETFIQRGIIEVAPLAFMRGRTLSNAFIILDEAQNTTAEQMLMFLTRMGENSKCVICGDPTQTDLPHRAESGLKQALQRLRQIDEIAFCYMGTEDVIRHPLVKKIVNAYSEYAASRVPENSDSVSERNIQA